MKKNEVLDKEKVQPNEKNTEKKKMGRFAKLYILAAICTACVCLIAVGTASYVSRNILRPDKMLQVAIPTPLPIDSLTDGTLNLKDIVPVTSTDIREEAASSEDETTDAVPLSSENDIQNDESVQTGLFKRETPPTLKAPLVGEILNECSPDKLKKSKTFGDWRTHNGVDFKAESGAPVNAAASGTVLRSEYDAMMGYIVTILHDDGYETLYANLTSNEMVEVGQKVNAGECIGSVGDSAVFEKLEDSHLHFELIKSGDYLNPMEYIK